VIFGLKTLFNFKVGFEEVRAVFGLLQLGASKNPEEINGKWTFKETPKKGKNKQTVAYA